MPHLYLKTVLTELDTRLNKTEQLAASAEQWVLMRSTSGIPKFSMQHRDIVAETAYFRAFLAWETFLEESYILYLLGKKPPKGSRLHGKIPSPTRAVAELIVAEGRSYAEWTKVDTIIERAKRHFRDSRPYFLALASNRTKIEEMNVIRNAIAHSSAFSKEKFKSLARSKLLGTYPPNLSIGGFLATTIPGSSPPQSFLEKYIDDIRLVADQIVPS
jgi:hypothetical protein